MRRIGGIFAVELLVQIVVIELPKNLLALVVKCTKIVLSVGAVVFGEIIEAADEGQNAYLVVCRKVSDTSGEVGFARDFNEPDAVPRVVIEFGDFFVLSVIATSPCGWFFRCGDA